MKNEIVEGVKYSVKYWWVSLLTGLLAVAVGIMSSANTMLTIGVLTMFFIASFIVSGIFEIFFALSNRQQLSNWGWTLASGIINLVFAGILIALPVGNTILFIFYVSFYILFQSFMALWGVFVIKKHDPANWWLLLILAILGVIFATFLLINPLFAANFITVIFSVSLICYGLFRIFYAFRLRKLKDSF